MRSRSRARGWIELTEAIDGVGNQPVLLTGQLIQSDADARIEQDQDAIMPFHTPRDHRQAVRRGGLLSLHIGCDGLRIDLDQIMDDIDHQPGALPPLFDENHRLTQPIGLECMTKAQREIQDRDHPSLPIDQAHDILRQILRR